MQSEKLVKDLDAILSEISEETLANMSEEELINLRKELNPYGRTIEGSNKYLTFSFTNIREQYLQKLITTGIISFLNRMCDEWHVPDGIPVIPVYEYLEDPQKIDSFAKNWKMTDQIKKDINENKAWMQKRVVVKQFLEEMFQYNPDMHVRSAYKPQVKDSARKVIDTPAAQLAISKMKKRDLEFREQMLEFDRVQKLIAMGADSAQFGDIAPKLDLQKYHYSTMDFSKWSDDDKNALRTACEMIPPVDIFAKFKRYCEVNYESLREAVEYLYCEKSQFELAVNPYSWHDTREEAEEFQKKHKAEVIADIIIADSGKWNLFAPFEQVRETTKYFNDKTIVLEEMAKQIESDSKLGEELMKNRVRIKKAKNTKEAGPDAEYFTKWREQNTTLKDMGALELNKESYADLDDDADAVQVDVIKFKDGGLTMEKSHFYTKAVAPEVPQA